jgi:signal transduction histidine kinase
MNKRYIFCTIILLVSLCSCNTKTVDKETQDRNDSIQKYLDFAGNDSLDSKLRNKFNGKAFSLVDLSKNDTLTRFYINSISYNYLDTNDWVDYKKTEKIHSQISTVAKDTLNLARFYRYKGGYFRKNNIYDSAYYYYIKAEKFYKKTNDQYGLAKVYEYKSLIEFNKDDYLGADLSAQKALNYYKTTILRKNQFDLLLIIGNSAHNLKNYKKAINTFNLAMSIAKKYNLINSEIHCVGTCLNNIGNVYREQKKYNKAIYYFNLSLKEKSLLKKDPVLFGFILNNLSDCKLIIKDYSGFPNLLFKSIELLRNSEAGIKESSVSYIYLSNYYDRIKDSLKAQLYADKALKIAKKTNSPYYYLTALSNAGSVDHKKAPYYIKEYHKKSDSLRFMERKARNQYYKIQLETNEISQDKATAIKQKWIVVTIAGVVMLIITLLLIITRQRYKQNRMQFQQSQLKTNEEIYDLMFTQKTKEESARQKEKKRIAIELHDGVLNRLASTRFNLNILSYQKDEETINKCLIHIEGIYEIEKEIRNIAHDLNTEIFKTNNSFKLLLNNFVVTQNQTTNSNYTIETDLNIDWSFISSEIKMNLYRIIQEACHNINKHARATNVLISLVLDKNNICLSITDNGKGFDCNANFEGMGLKNIKYRVKSLKGELVIKSNNNNNTSINISIPHNNLV